MQAAVWFVAQAEGARVSDRQTFCETDIHEISVLCFKNGMVVRHTAQSGSACSAASISRAETKGTIAAESARANPRIALILGDDVSLVGYDRIGVSLASGSGNRRRRVGVTAASPLSTRLRPPRLGLYGTVDGTGSTLRSGSPHSY